MTSPSQEFIEARIERVAECGCWIWMRALGRHGYGNCGRGRAHRVSWEAHRGPIPNGLHVLHDCDVKCCVNPDHLYLGTSSDNMRDVYRRGRKRPQTHSIGEKNASALLTPDQVLEIRAAASPTRETAKRFGVSMSTIWDIRSRRRWRHI